MRRLEKVMPDHIGPHADQPTGPEPRPPVQIYPAPDGDALNTATNTNICELREAIISELREERPWDSPIPFRTRLALYAVFVASICIILAVWQERRNRNIARQHPIEKPLSVESIDPIVAKGSTRGLRTADKMSAPPPFSQHGLNKGMGEDESRIPNDGLDNSEKAQARSQIESVPPFSNHLEANKRKSSELAEVEVIEGLIQQDPSFDSRRAIARLSPYALSKDDAARESAARVLLAIHARLEAEARDVARGAAEKADEWIESQNFSAALEVLSSAAQILPQDVNWVTQRGIPQLQALSKHMLMRREQAQSLAFSDLETGLSENDPSAKSRLIALLNHPDLTFRTAAAELQIKIVVQAAKKMTENRRRDGIARAAWLEFFQKLSASVGAGDIDIAEKLCVREPEDVLMTGGVQTPRKVLESCLSEVLAIRRLYDTALESAGHGQREVHLALRHGRPVKGTIEEVIGRQLIILVSGSARVGVRIDYVTSSGLLEILPYGVLSEHKLLPALWALTSYEMPDEASANLTHVYSISKDDLPIHWAERFKLEKMRKLEANAVQKFMALKHAIESGHAEDTKKSLDEARSVLTHAEGFELDSAERQSLLSAAVSLIARMNQQTLVIQNGVLPTADYAGFSTDQISEYRDSSRRVDVGVQYGLKLGASGGLQRVLIRFEGLEAALNRARVRRATLELYQIDSPLCTGAVIALFRLKRPWISDAGTWISYNKGKKLDWQIPGAIGELDIDSKEESRISIDKTINQWRSWDVTQYVNDVLSGRTENNGFLMRVVNSEPEFHVRFYPETDLEKQKDVSLRPRLVLNIESSLAKEKVGQTLFSAPAAGGQGSSAP